ncbi:MAG: hypothetical protein Q8907_07595 [Bacteroidota bacterium]|nr:hypothetical protein [Bacteroidota bacterium]MDP4226579.1 hypothetical protein [Bacteroidota bacterium]MDP4274126.1 hypothetical protein [Bacteroidota bacterium]
MVGNTIFKRKIFPKKLIVLLLVAGAIVYSCDKLETYPPVPEIHFKNFTIIDSATDYYQKKGVLAIDFVDGDGDLGLDTASTVDSLNADVFIKLQKKINGQYITDTSKYNYIMPYMEKTGQNKTLKGTIKIKFEYTKAFINQYDTIRYYFYIVDRAKHHSNTDTTSDIGLK